MSTPFDDQTLLWVWRGDTTGASSLDDLCKTIRARAPNVTGLIVKTSDALPATGPRWMGYWDKSPIAIDGPAAIDRWIETLARYDLSFHAWCVPRGLDAAGEVDLIAQACNRPGVRSMLLDVEPYDDFWSGGKAGIRPFMVRLWRKLPRGFHVGLTVDPRRQHFASIHPEEWFPFVFSVHPQCYWATFESTPEAVISEAFSIWRHFGRWIIPVLQGKAAPEDIRAARQLTYAPGLSWWRYGVMTPAQLAAI